MNIEQIDWLRNNTKELVNDLPQINWLDKLDNHYLLGIVEKQERQTTKQLEQIKYIEWLIEHRKK